MTWLKRSNEPAELKAVREAQLPILRGLPGVPKSDDIKGYRVVSGKLWKSQYLKCCYCEAKIPESFNDVEHFRPKATANRLPGCSSDHGYWWLAFTWTNLLYSCPGCNRISKGILFPLGDGSQGALAEAEEFHSEVPLLLDPYEHSHVAHIEYRFVRLKDGGRWYARPRKRSQCGSYTIKTLGLNRSELLELRQDHYEVNLVGLLADFKKVMDSKCAEDIRIAQVKLSRLFGVRAVFSSFSYDVLVQNFPNEIMEKFGCSWPNPTDL